MSDAVKGAVGVKLPEWGPTTVEQMGCAMRTALAQGAEEGHAVIDSMFDHVDVQQERELRRTLVAQGSVVGEVAVQAMIAVLRRQSFSRRMEAHADFAVLLDGLRKQREGDCAIAERDVSGVPLQ